MNEQSTNRPLSVTVLGLIVCALVLVGVFAPMVLRHQPEPTKPGHARAVYVRDASHHCVARVRREPSKAWDYLTEKLVASKGYTLYACDGGIVFHIEDDEEQP